MQTQPTPYIDASFTRGADHRQDLSTDVIGQPIPDAHDQGQVGVFVAGCGQRVLGVSLQLCHNWTYVQTNLVRVA
jgi:hypothetical protein